MSRTSARKPVRSPTALPEKSVAQFNVGRGRHVDRFERAFSGRVIAAGRRRPQLPSLLPSRCTPLYFLVRSFFWDRNSPLILLRFVHRFCLIILV